MSKRYLLDANAFIEAKNRYYGFDIRPGFWSSLVTQHGAKLIFSIDRIAEELKEQDDEVKQWVENHAPRHILQKDRGPGRYRQVPGDSEVGIFTDAV